MNWNSRVYSHDQTRKNELHFTSLLVASDGLTEGLLISTSLLVKMNWNSRVYSRPSLSSVATGINSFLTHFFSFFSAALFFSSSSLTLFLSNPQNHLDFHQDFLKSPSFSSFPLWNPSSNQKIFGFSQESREGGGGRTLTQIFCRFFDILGLQR